MNVTDNTRATISHALREKSMSQSDLAKKMGLGKAWVSKLLNGGIKQLSDEHTDLIEEILEIEFFVAVRKDKVPDLAVKLGKVMENRPELTGLVSSLLSLDSSTYYTIPHIPTKDLVDFGNEIMRAAHEDPDKAGKVGKIAITWLNKRLQELKP